MDTRGCVWTFFALGVLPNRLLSVDESKGWCSMSLCTLPSMERRPAPVLEREREMSVDAEVSNVGAGGLVDELALLLKDKRLELASSCSPSPVLLLMLASR